MLLIQAVITTVSRSAGKIFNTAFGWATIMLFGKVPQSRQRILTALGAGSVVWVVTLVGLAIPQFATWLLAFIRLPSSIQQEWARAAMLAGAILLPPLVGGLSLVVVEPAARPKDLGGKLRAVIRGYPYAFGLASTLVMMVLFAPIMHVRNMARRWNDAHVPIIVEPKDYLTVVDETQKALRVGGLETTKTRATWMMRAPTKVLTTFARAAFSNLVADNLTTLRSDRLEVLLHPADLVIRGPDGSVARARAILAEHLTFIPAYMTWDKDANEVEDRLRALWESMREQPQRGSDGKALEELKAIERDMAKFELPFEEWEVLYREKLLVERGLLQVMSGITDKPLEPGDIPPEQITTAAEDAEPRPSLVPVVPAVAGAAAIGVLAGRWLRQRSTNDEDHRAA